MLKAALEARRRLEETEAKLEAARRRVQGLKSEVGAVEEDRNKLLEHAEAFRQKRDAAKEEVGPAPH